MTSADSVHRIQAATNAADPQADWLDTQPWLRRSEAFFEDLVEPQAPVAEDSRTSRTALSNLAGRVPLLGLVLAGFLHRLRLSH